MKEYTFLDSPIKIYGIAEFEKRRNLHRLPSELMEKIPSLSFLGKRPVGARMCFRTNSPVFKIKIELETLSVDIGMSIYACQSAFVYLGEKSSSKFLGIANPYNYESKVFEREFNKSSEMEDITVFLPRNEIVKNISVFINDDAEICQPTPYKYTKPVLFYGSSITESGICGNMACAYTAIISRHLDTDYYNFGFSGNAKGEIEMAEYISSLDISAFVYDYDHNAPTAEHLRKTHLPFFKLVREKKPNLPIIMMSRPYANYGDEEMERKSIIKATYDYAIQSGDKNVYFIDGEDYFENDSDKELFFIDTVHPTDIGFYKMAQVIEPVIKKILED